MTRDERAQLAWQVLVGCAANRQTITYEMLAEKIGMGGPGTLAHLLGSIMYFCKQHDWPPLTVLVVKKTEGVPGVGLTMIETIGSDREAVFGHRWYEVLPPSASQLRDAYEHGTATESEDKGTTGGHQE